MIEPIINRAFKAIDERINAVIRTLEIQEASQHNFHLEDEAIRLILVLAEVTNCSEVPYNFGDVRIHIEGENFVNIYITRIEQEMACVNAIDVRFGVNQAYFGDFTNTFIKTLYHPYLRMNEMARGWLLFAIPEESFQEIKKSYNFSIEVSGYKDLFFVMSNEIG